MAAQMKLLWILDCVFSMALFSAGAPLLAGEEQTRFSNEAQPVAQQTMQTKNSGW
jgi:hypothetical protein